MVYSPELGRSKWAAARVPVGVCRVSCLGGLPWGVVMTDTPPKVRTAGYVLVGDDEGGVGGCTMGLLG